MVESRCYWCDDKFPVIPNTKGELNVTMGCCKNCQTFSCGHHAQRDHYAMRYSCFHCDIKMLSDSAEHIVRNHDLNEIARKAVENALDKKKSYSNMPVDNSNLFISYQDFKKRRPGYNDWFKEIEKIANNLNVEVLHSANFLNVSIDEKCLFIAAAFIINKLSKNDLNNDELYPDYINELKIKIKEEGGTQWEAI